MIKFCLILLLSAVLSADDRFKGCYKTVFSTQTYNISWTTTEQCIEECRIKYYRYSMIQSTKLCYCGNYLGEEVNNTVFCNQICDSFCDNVTDVYATGNLAPGPPEDVKLTNVTDTSAHISWKPPKSYTKINGYSIKATVIRTYANYIPNSPEWTYLNDTFSTKIILLPATKYNITLCAQSPEGSGALFSQIIETELKEPENPPESPKIIKRDGEKMEIELSPTSNSNGPITSYLVIVFNEDSQQIFQEDILKSYDEARREGLNYYITAQLKPENIQKKFIVGDKNNYGGYYNAPLQKDITYSIIAGLVSTLNGKTKRAFSSLKHSIKAREEVIEVSGDSPAVIIGLSVAIGLLSFMFIAGIIGFIILKSRVTNRRHRLSENQELTLQGPMIEVENNGYIPEEEHTKVSYYRDLKQKVRTIPYNQLKVEPSNLLGIGRFGRVNSGSIYENSTLIPVAVYSVQDKKLSVDDKKNMLRDLDVLIKTRKHDNIIALVGTCETSQMVFVVLEYVSMNLKDLLLGSRDSLPGKFSNMTENQALDIALNIVKGMSHLASNKIIHKQLCARNIMVANGFIPKISGYGLSQFYSHNNLPDYTRWTAMEVFKGQSHNLKSDVWSFGCLLWEICVLGGTPYGNFSNNEIPERIIKGLRLPQLQYFSDELYQFMLSCWQIDMDERPDFNVLLESLQTFQENSLIPCLSFNLYPNFQYEQFYPDMEIAVRPVF
ncbi:putative tyrosine-protein kinase Wsck [Tribolium madens]|uniref:putative tyrosine-protein kinase Wsck n=1 Tax=Tribolium madens TaxID=41895 RepID=UPI001CF75035|nr:putative tyrosine-protein kinase Wsck [Tribolium madens]